MRNDFSAFNCKIVEYEPVANMSIFHHILVFGCTTPGRENGIYNCGDMSTGGGSRSDSQSSSLLSDILPPCADGEQIVYAWGMGAPPFKLPANVSYKIGGNSPIKYLALQMHYKLAGMRYFMFPFDLYKLYIKNVYFP